MKTYGSVRLCERAAKTNRKSKKPPRMLPAILLDLDPHVLSRAKRVFAKIRPTGEPRMAVLPDTIDTCRDLLWFRDRFPLVIAADVEAHLEHRARLHIEKTQLVMELLAGAAMPRPFDLAVPARDYQTTGAEAWLRSFGMLLADDVGVGKTATAICGLTQPETRPALVVTLTHLPAQWSRELNKFAPGLRVAVLQGGRPYDLTAPARCKGTRKAHDFRPREVAPLFDGRAQAPSRCRHCGMLEAHARAVGMPDVVITSYSKLATWGDDLAGRFKAVIFDECQELRRDESIKYLAAESVASVATYRIGLSATPIFNYGGEFWCVMNVLAPDALGTKDEFVREWCGGQMSQSGQSSIRDPRTFGEFMRSEGLMLRRTRADVARELPGLTTLAHHVESDPAELEKVSGHAGELARFLLRGAEQKRGEKRNAAEELSNVLRQATGIAKAPYVAEFVRILAEQFEKVVLFAWHRAVYDVLMAKLGRFGVDPNGLALLYTGSENAAQKEKAREAFIDPTGARVLIMSLRAGAGLDGLQDVCRTVVFGELDWSPGVHEQCIGRVARDGQRDPVVAYFLVADEGSDPTIAETLNLKRMQIEPVRDPTLELVEKLEVDNDRIKKLAAAYLEQRGGDARAAPVAERRDANGRTLDEIIDDVSNGV